MPVRTRFAPSPTGFLHAGGVRTALFAWLYARQQGGQFILRIEDTDKKREETGSSRHIQDSLMWLGLNWDEDYLQSERLDIYEKHAQELISKGLAYADPYSSEEVDEFRRQAKADKRAFLFRDHRPSELSVPGDWYGKLPLRFKVPEVKRYKWPDMVRGQLSAGEEALDDFVLIKADGYPTYNFAHVVDDHLMSVSHVMRGEEFLASVPKFLSLLDAFGWDWPQFATLPPVLDKTGGKKLSKRAGAKDVLEYRDAGYLPQAVVNFLASLGWNDGSDQEVFTAEELIAKFSLERIQRSGAKFDDDKLDWLNWQHFTRLIETDVLGALAHAQIEPGQNGRGYLQRAAHAAASKSGSITDFQRQMAIFTEEGVPELADEVLSGLDPELSRERAREYLHEAAEKLADLKSWTAQTVEQSLRSTQAGLDAQPRVFLNLVRWAASGLKVSPSLFEMLVILGQERTVDRLRRAAG